MTSTSGLLVLFWLFWLIACGLLYYGYFEFIHGVFGQYAAADGRYLSLWISILGIATLLIGGSLYLKSLGHISWATTLLAIPVVPALLYGLFILLMVVGGKGSNWR